MVYEHSGANGKKIDISDPMNPIGELPDNPVVDEENDSEEETEECNIVYDLGEDDEEFVNFRGNATNCTFTAEILNVTQRKQRGQRRSKTADVLPNGTMYECITHNEENELVCDACDKEFSSITNKNQHVCKVRRLPNDMVSVGLREDHKLI